MFRRPGGALLAAVVLFISGCAGGDGEPSHEGSTQPITRGDVGDALVSVDSLSGERLRIRLATFDPSAKPDDPGIGSALLTSDGKSPRRFVWAKLLVIARNSGRARASLIGEQFLGIDSKAQRYEGVGVDPGGVFEPDAAGAALEPGDNVRGFVAVPVPRSARIVEVRYTPIGGEGTLRWRVSPRS